jgi:hypothetical protein
VGSSKIKKSVAWCHGVLHALSEKEKVRKEKRADAMNGRAKGAPEQGGFV